MLATDVAENVGGGGRARGGVGKWGGGGGDGKWGGGRGAADLGYGNGGGEHG